ncbi:MAG: hypothetical protein ACTS8R_09360 [Arsenophonus sp. NC-QC1-MAG3]
MKRGSGICIRLLTDRREENSFRKKRLWLLDLEIELLATNEEYGYYHHLVFAL